MQMKKFAFNLSLKKHQTKAKFTKKTKKKTCVKTKKFNYF